MNWKSSWEKKKTLLTLNDNFIGSQCLCFLYFLVEALVFGSYPFSDSGSQGKASYLMSGLVSDNATEFPSQGQESHHSKRNLYSSPLQLPGFKSALLAAVLFVSPTRNPFPCSGLPPGTWPTTNSCSSPSPFCGFPGRGRYLKKRKEGRKLTVFTKDKNHFDCSN